MVYVVQIIKYNELSKCTANSIPLLFDIVDLSVFSLASSARQESRGSKVPYRDTYCDEEEQHKQVVEVEATQGVRVFRSIEQVIE